jgi:5'-nucleotidase
LVALGACGGGHSMLPAPDASQPDASLPPGTVAIRILAFNDFHGALDAVPNAAPGAAALAGAIAMYRTPNTIVVSAGDLIGASPLDSALFHDEPTIEIMNAIGLDVHGVGNHEFDEGTAELVRMKMGGCHPVDGCQFDATFSGSSFPFLAANVMDTATGQLLFPPYLIKDVAGVKIAFVGETLQGTPATTLASAIPELAFTGEADTANALLPMIHAEGAQIAVLLDHQGGNQVGQIDDCAGFTGPIVGIATALADSYAIVASAHTHAFYNCKVGTKLVTSAGANGNALTIFDLDVDPATQAIVAMTAQNVAVTSATTDAMVAAIVAHADTLVAPLANRLVGSITGDITIGSLLSLFESPIGDVVADAMREASGADVALMNRGGLRANLAFAATSPEVTDGQVRYTEAFAVQPFSNLVSTVTMTGADLVAALDVWLATAPLQVSGITYVIRASHVVAADVTVGGVPLVATQTYRVTVNSIVATPNLTPSIANATNVTGEGVDLDLLVAYLGAHPMLAPPSLDRITNQ